MSTTLFHSRQSRKGAQCSKYWIPLSHNNAVCNVTLTPDLTFGIVLNRIPTKFHTRVWSSKTCIRLLLFRTPWKKTAWCLLSIIVIFRNTNVFGLHGFSWTNMEWQTFNIYPREHHLNFPNLVHTITPGDANTSTQAKRHVWTSALYHGSVITSLAVSSVIWLLIWLKYSSNL